MVKLLDKSTQTWKVAVIFLAVSMLFVQIIQLHIHIYDHQHNDVEYNAHQITVHSDHTATAFDHHNEALTVEFSSHYSNRATTLRSLFPAVFIVILGLILPFFINRKPRNRDNSVFLPKCYSLIPLPRGPPLF